MRYKKILVGVVFFISSVIAFFFFKLETAKNRVAIDVSSINSPTFLNAKNKSGGPVNDLIEPAKHAASPNLSPTPKPFAGSLPAPNLPLIKIVDLLKAESAAGNYRASCRLGSELSRCEMIYPLEIKMAADLQRSINTLDVGSAKYLEAAEKLAHYKENVAFDAPVCDGFTNPDKLEAWRFNFTAALQGHIASKAEFATRPPLNPVEFYKNLDGWAAYREYAPTFLLDAANAGNNMARWSLARAYAGEVSIPGVGNLGGVELAKRDPYKAAIYAYTLATIGSEPSAQRGAARLIKEIEQQLTPNQIAAAKAESGMLNATSLSTSSVSAENAAGTYKERRGFDKLCDEP